MTLLVYGKSISVILPVTTWIMNVHSNNCCNYIGEKWVYISNMDFFFSNRWTSLVIRNNKILDESMKIWSPKIANVSHVCLQTKLDRSNQNQITTQSMRINMHEHEIFQVEIFKMWRWCGDRIVSFQKFWIEDRWCYEPKAIYRWTGW